MTMEAQVKQLRDQVQKREAEISTLKQHLAMLTSDFKYNLKLLEDRDFELDQTEAQLEQIKNAGKQKEKETEVLNSEIANFKVMAERDTEQIGNLQSTLSQYKESVRSVRQRLEEALQLRDQELSCHRSEIEALKTKIHQQSESLKVQEKGLSDAMKACERTWSQRYSECHKTVLTLVAEQETLLKEKLTKDRELEITQNRVLELQKSVDELTAVTDVSKKECTSLTGELETLQERASTRLRELDQEKQNLERNLRKKILEEYDGKIAELLAQLQSIEYAVSLERREANTRLITLEAEQVEKMTSLHQTIQELRTERNDLLDKVGKLEKELSSLRENLYHLKNNGRRLSQKEESLTEEVSTLQQSLLEAKAMLENSQLERTHELAVLQDSLREARSSEKLLFGKEAEQVRRIGVLEQLLGGARSEVEHLSQKDSEGNVEMLMAQEALEKTTRQLHMSSQKSSEQMKEIASLRKSLMEARNEGAVLSKAQAEHTEELTILKQSLYDARTTEDIMLRKNEEYARDLENLRQLLKAGGIREDLTKKKLEDQAKEIVTLRESLRRAKAEGASMMDAEAAHTEEISLLRSSLAETQKQADAASKHAQHLEAIIEVTQAESRRRVEIKECVSSLLASAQDKQEVFFKTLSDSPDEFSTQMMDENMEFSMKCKARKMAHSNDSTEMTGLKTDMGLQEENKYLKTRVEELQGENFKVGQVISELRNELETVGLLQPSIGTALQSLAAPYKNEVAPSENENVPSHREAKMPMGRTLRNEVPHAIVRPRVVDTSEKKGITLSEKEELLTLRALLKDVHNRHALSYKQGPSMSDDVPAEKAPERRAELHEGTFKCPRKSDLPNGSSTPSNYKDRHLLSDERVAIPRLFTDEIRSSATQPPIIPSTCTRVASGGLHEPRPKRTPTQLKSSQGVSAEVVKLNEKIARVRQQLTSLCSPEQSVSSGQKSSEEGMTQCRSRYAGKNEPFETRSENERAGGKVGTTKDKGELHRRSTYAHHNAEAHEDKFIGNVPRIPNLKYDQHRNQQPDLYLNDLAGNTTKRSNRKPQRSDVVRSTESILPSKHSAATPKQVRIPATESLGTKAQLKVGRKVRVRIPSDTSSRSDVVCSHCQECMSGEDCQDLLSSSDISNTESRKRKKDVKERIDPKCSNSGRGHSSAFPFFGSEHMGSNHDHVRKSQHQACTWSDTDESETTSILQRTSSTQYHDVALPDRRKPSHKSDDRVRERREDKVRNKSHTTREETVLRKQSSIGRQKGLGSATAPQRSLKVDKSVPAILRERVDPNQIPCLSSKNQIGRPIWDKQHREPPFVKTSSAKTAIHDSICLSQTHRYGNYREFDVSSPNTTFTQRED